MKGLLISLVLLAMTTGSRAAEIQTGNFQLQFSERSPFSELTKVAGRMGVQSNALRQRAAEAEYQLEKESFDVYVPKEYTGQETYGLLVWVSPGTTVGKPPGWEGVLDKYKLIWVGANNSGNDRLPLIRMGLALDAAHNMKGRYRIDEKRVYIAGLSGGGRVSSMLCVGFPDVFAGGCYIIGCNYYREVFSREQGAMWRRGFTAPAAEILAEAKKRRHVILEGETDANREQSLAYAEAYRRDGFKFVKYIEVPGMGHVPPNAEWFEKGIAAMDAGLAAASTQPTTRSAEMASESESADTPAGQALKAARELAGKDTVAGCDALHEVVIRYANSAEGKIAAREAEKLLADPKVRKKVEDRQEADKLVRVSRVFIANQMYADARKRLEKVVADYADTPAAKEAKKMLEEIKGK
ncbi:MAG: hypothetical protein ACM359_05950 [Bacillota bacterium]